MRAVSAIVLAAGLSSRMQGPNKLLQPWKQGTVVGAVVQTLIACCPDVVVVVGHQADAVREAVKPAKTAYNQDYALGLGGSIAVGVEACPDATGYLMVLADMPDLDPAVVRGLLDAFAGADSDAIVGPVYASEPHRLGHPILFGSDYRAELLALQGDQGARSIIERHGERLLHVPSPAKLDDLDRPEDFTRARRVADR